MKELFKKYLWLWEFIGVAIILGVGIVILFMPNILEFIVGVAFIIFAGFRVVPLIKTTTDKPLKWIYLGEVIINLIAGAVLIGLVVQEKELEVVFGYIIGGVLYLRALIYFFSTTMRNESTDFAQFIAHIIFITVGTVVIANKGFDAKDLAWVVFALAILSSIFIGFDGYKNYRNYRNEKAAKDITKKVKQKKEIEVPTSEEIIPPQDEVQEEKEEINA